MLTIDPNFRDYLRHQLRQEVALDCIPARPRGRSPRVLAIASGVVGAVTVGGVAVATLRPAGDVAAPPLLPPTIVNGVGSTEVAVPAPPTGAKYLQLELTCYDGHRCHTPGGGTDQDGAKTEPIVQRDALPVTADDDPENAQKLDPLDPSRGVPIDVDAGTHWRLYAVYTDKLVPSTAALADGRTLGLPGLELPPDLVPATATNGKAGWVSYDLLTIGGHPTLTASGTVQQAIPVYASDGVTQIGLATVDG